MRSEQERANDLHPAVVPVPFACPNEAETTDIER